MSQQTTSSGNSPCCGPASCGPHLLQIMKGLRKSQADSLSCLWQVQSPSLETSCFSGARPPAAGGGSLSAQEGEPAEPPKSRLRQMLSPFKEASANRRLLALCSAQALCSVATLIHDTYLPLYLQDVLGLSNTRVCN